MKVLIIYENIPYSTEMYIVDAEADDLKDLFLAHRNYVNDCSEDSESAVDKITAYLHEENWCLSEFADEDKIGQWVNCRVDSQNPVDINNEKIEKIILTGFIN